MSPSENETAELLEETQADLHNAIERRSRMGSVAHELELRGLALQHRAAYTAFVDDLWKAAAKAQREGFAAGRRFLMTHCQADIHLLGVGVAPPANWYVREQLASPFFTEKLLQAGPLGDEKRTALAEYVEHNFLRPGLERLWRQIGGTDQEPLPS